MKFTALLAASVIAIAATAAHAEDVVPDAILQPVVTSIVDRQVDIRGLLPGMRLNEARAALANSMGVAPNERREQLRLRDGSISVSSAPYVSWLVGESSGERTAAMFSGMPGGNQLVLVRRDGEYQRVSDAPMFDDFVSGLIAKYGEPSYRRDAYQASVFYWTYREGQQVQCDPQGRPQCIDGDGAFMVMDQIGDSVDVIVYAAVGRRVGDPNRVQQFRMSSTDLRIKRATDEADSAALQPALEAALAEAAANAPKAMF